MLKLSIFDIIGPVMVGPSSSHTAGAVRLGQLAQAILGETPKEALILLHGSFAEVYKGHSTDKALLAGLLGMKPDDERIKNAFELARLKNMKYKIQAVDLGLGYHPNTVKFVLKNSHHKIELIGASIGGGNVILQKIDDFPVNFTENIGSSDLLLISHKNRLGILADITEVLKHYHFNISNMQSSCLEKGGRTLTMIELEQEPSQEVVESIKWIDDIEFIRPISRIISS